MGNTSSSLASLSKEEVADAVASHGAKYEPYAEAIRENGVDGEILAALTEEDEINEVFDDLEIESKLHRKVLQKSLKKAMEAAPCESSTTKKEEPSPAPVANGGGRPYYPEYGNAAASFGFTNETPDAELEDFNSVAREILDSNDNAGYAGVNLITSGPLQVPLAARLRTSSNGGSDNIREKLIVPRETSLCYELAHETSGEHLVKPLPIGNPFGPTYIGYVIKDTETGDRLGGVCQAATIRDEQDKQEQLIMLKRLAHNVEKQLQEKRALQRRAKLLKEQMANMQV